MVANTRDLAKNTYYQIADRRWADGADGADIARELAEAFEAMVQAGTSVDVREEFGRMLSLPPREVA